MGVGVGVWVGSGVTVGVGVTVGSGVTVGVGVGVDIGDCASSSSSAVSPPVVSAGVWAVGAGASGSV